MLKLAIFFSEHAQAIDPLNVFTYECISLGSTIIFPDES